MIRCSQARHVYGGSTKLNPRVNHCCRITFLHFFAASCPPYVWGMVYLVVRVIWCLCTLTCFFYPRMSGSRQTHQTSIERPMRDLFDKVKCIDVHANSPFHPLPAQLCSDCARSWRVDLLKHQVLWKRFLTG